MADEATIRSYLQIRKTNAAGDVVHIDYQSRPSDFRADVATTSGPAGGKITATVVGVDVDLSELTTPGLCRIQNQDATNYITVGIFDTSATEFYPFMELLPGESYVFRLSRNIGKEVEAPGTGTGYAGATTLRIKADTAPCPVLVEAFSI